MTTTTRRRLDLWASRRLLSRVNWLYDLIGHQNTIVNLCRLLPSESLVLMSLFPLSLSPSLPLSLSVFVGDTHRRVISFTLPVLIMSSCSSQVALFLVLMLVGKHGIFSIPACIIIDTNMVQEAEGDASSLNNRSSSSILLRNLRMLDHQRSSDLTKFLVEPIPISHIDLQETSSPVSITFNLSSLKKSLAEPVVERTFSPCSLELLNEIEAQMVVPFEFRRLRMEQPDHQTKFLDDDPRESVPDLSTAVYERRSDPEGLRFCRICRDGRSHANQHASSERLSLYLLPICRSLDSTNRVRNRDRKSVV